MDSFMVHFAGMVAYHVFCTWLTYRIQDCFAIWMEIHQWWLRSFANGWLKNRKTSRMRFDVFFWEKPWETTHQHTKQPTFPTFLLWVFWTGIKLAKVISNILQSWGKRGAWGVLVVSPYEILVWFKNMSSTKRQASSFVISNILMNAWLTIFMQLMM